ncbi:MAG: lipopolysaccharide heptosyltransferase I [Methylococcaceae bacterium]|nr:lipopolysaccharide heptosyltransferase I [Methylococcaceae bacterium]
MKIAVVKLSALGDIVHAMVALQFIKQQRPDISVDWIVEERFAELLRHNPDINAIHTVNLKALKQNKSVLWGEIAKVRLMAKNHYDLVIDAQGLLKSAITACLLGKKRAGFDRHSIRETLAAWFYQTQVHCDYAANSIDRNTQVITEPLGLHITSDQIIAKQPFLYFKEPAVVIEPLLSQGQPTILFVIGSTWPSRNYPKEQLLTVINALQQRSLILWGSPEEHETATWLASHSQYAKRLPKLDLNSLKALLAQVDLVIGNDTGPTHMAWGLNRPSITLFGPTPVSRVYQTDINKVLKSPSSVNPYKLNKQDFSIAKIKPEMVVSLAQNILTI